ncbi:hypothetical protein ACJIZ3_024650 [Penstemon smallii]|uniref:Uncharacterized protein n=1 Tax=Penstemon smallii TaxID=265156 RepID=A0ABD3TSI1_9LAMI
MYNPRTQVFHRHDHLLNHTYKDKKYQLAQNHESSHISCVQFRPNYHLQEAMESDDSDSPPLWNNMPEYSRAQAITRGRWELMEMVKNMPESSYELSLKDLVEHLKIEAESQTNQEGERSAANRKQILHQRGVLNNVHQERKKNDNNVIKSGGLETKGLFLNMVFPLPLKSKKKKNFASNTSGGFLSRTEEGIKGGGERDWWKKKFSGSSDGDCSRSRSSGRSYSATRRSSKKYPIFCGQKHMRAYINLSETYLILC